MKMVLLSRLYSAGHMLLEGKLDMKECFTDNPWEAIDEIRQAECILIGNQRFDRALFNEAVSLRILAKQGSGTDNIDLEPRSKCKDCGGTCHDAYTCSFQKSAYV